MSDSRFLQTGRRISMQLKLRTAAGALAHARADWGGGWHKITDEYFLMKPIYADFGKSRRTHSLTPRI